MQARTSVHDRLCVLRHAAVQQGVSGIVVKLDRIEVAGAQTAAAADTVVLIDVHLARCLVKYQTAVGAFFLTAHAAAAAIDIDGWFAAAVLITLAGT